MMRLPRSSEFLPRAPGLPPDKPVGAALAAIRQNGHVGSRQKFKLANDSIAAAMLAALRPSPSESDSSRMRSGYKCSNASTGVFQLFVMCVCVALAPSESADAPMPPAMVS